MLDENIARDMDLGAMGSSQRVTAGGDSGADIDEAALNYVLGLEDETSQGEAESQSPSHGGQTPPSDGDGTVAGDAGETAPSGQGPGDGGVPTGGVASWRDAVKSDDATAFRHERTTERNMRMMSSLWNRLFPIDYEAIPVPDYVAMEEGDGDVPIIAQDATPPATDAGVAASATVAGLGLGAASALFGRHQVTQSDTSNEDTVMIGNAALSEMLSQHQQDDFPATADEDSAEPAEASAEEDPLPESLSSLYDEAMSMISEPESEEEEGGVTEIEQEAAGEPADDFEDVDEDAFRNDGSPAPADDADDIDDVVAPADAESIRTDYASDDYRKDTGPTNIYESEEWLQIEREIEETNRAVEVGLSQLDALAHVGTDEDDSLTATADGIASPVMPANPTEETEAETVAQTDDADGFADVPETDGFADVSETDGFADVPETDGFADVPDAPTGEESGTTFGGIQGEDLPDTRGLDESPVRQGILARIAGIFQRKPQPQPSEYVADGTNPRPATWDSPPAPEGAYEVVSAESHDEETSLPSDAGMEGEPPSAHSEESPSPHGPHEAEAANATDGEDVPETLPDAGIWNGDSAEEVVVIGDDYRSPKESDASDIPSVGEDYRQPSDAPEDVALSPDDTFFGMEPVEIESEGTAFPEDSSDDLIQMLNDDVATEQPHDYRAETSDAGAEADEDTGTSSPTMPMPQDEFPVPRPPAVTQADAGRPEGPVRSRGTMPREIRRIDKARLRNLQLDASPDLMLPLPTSRNGQVNANVRMKATDFLNPKKPGAGTRSSYIKLSVRPSKVRMSAVTLLPEGAGYVPEESPMGTRMREQPRYEYEPIRRIGETIDA